MKLGFGTNEWGGNAELWILETLLDALSGVRNLDSVIAFSCTSDLNFRTITSRLVSLLPKFPNLQRFDIPDPVLESIVKDKIRLPRCLKRVGIIRANAYHRLPFHTRLQLLISLLRRLRRGVTLDINHNPVGDWRELDKVRELKVVWRMGRRYRRYGNDSYTCGTGHPEKLLIN
ncbi:hypothetical protein D9613_003596 [Agrocybe pediades]|uniref:Uncharacterized protein n=1 Tax=Agrocybe pediades TaxID=84607 RepID=A0A8H4QIK3_9AGAR|nr:hypothetical protein D9613_003596 [Agrocybe pediades]